jgi:hypothetical protein
MTDPLTDAVKRLKGLQEDVERLKSGQNEEGEPRLLFQIQEAAVADDTQGAPQAQRRVAGNINHAQFDTSAYNTTSYNGVISRPEIVDYDLSTPGTVVSLRDTREASTFGFTVEATDPTTFIIESVPETAGPFRLGTFTNRTAVSSGFEAPEATAIRIRNTTTAPGTADAILNDDIK